MQETRHLAKRMNDTTPEPFTAYWIGRCPAKGCRVVLHVDLSMKRLTWQSAEYDRLGRRHLKTKKREWPAEHEAFPHYWQVFCLVHHREIGWHRIEGKHNPDPEKVCDGRCMGATGPNCECACGGANHGRNYHVGA